jgi:hypothetical protein
MPNAVPPEIIDLARQIACEHGLDPALACAVIEQESAWNPWAVRYEPAFLSRYIAPLYTAGKFSPTEAYMRSMSWGLMQVMGQVAREFGFKEQSLAELCDPATGIEFGCRILAAGPPGWRAPKATSPLRSWHGTAAPMPTIPPKYWPASATIPPAARDGSSIGNPVMRRHRPRESQRFRASRGEK